MTNSQLFTQAHAMTKQTIRQGDCYKTTFGLCLKAIKEKQASKQVVSNNVMILFVIAFVAFINKTSNNIKSKLGGIDGYDVLLVLPLVFMIVYYLKSFIS